MKLKETIDNSVFLHRREREKTCIFNRKYPCYFTRAQTTTPPRHEYQVIVENDGVEISTTLAGKDLSSCLQHDLIMIEFHISNTWLNWQFLVIRGKFGNCHGLQGSLAGVQAAVSYSYHALNCNVHLIVEELSFKPKTPNRT